MRLDVGVTVLNSDRGERRRIDRLSDIHLHPDYDGGRTNKFDAAVITLSRPVNIEPIALAGPSSGDSLEDPPGTATVSGWGSTVAQPPFGPGPPPQYPKGMSEGEPPLVSDTQCGTSYTRSFYPALMVCAGEGAIDTCQGDSGGPMFVDDSAPERRQIDITSFGRGCGAPGYPGVYSEVNADPIYDSSRKPPAFSGHRSKTDAGTLPAVPVGARCWKCRLRLRRPPPPGGPAP